MLPDRVSNPGPLTYESGALPIALRGPASHFGEMGLNARNNIISLTGRRKFSHVRCDLIPLQIFFHFHINQHQGPTDTS